ncbi:hypothetical protein PflCFBP13517_18185 [Pseudomonas fluorescens]|nr:hypothetical protein PflCFBP13517_18185 [Pseudomonas fluorescens]
MRISEHGARMGFFDFFKSRKADKRYEFSDSTSGDRVSAVCGAMRAQFQLLNGAPPLVQNEVVVDLWLLGYLSGFYDAHCQYSSGTFEDSALELVYSVFYGEAAAEIAIREHFVVCIALQDSAETAHLFGLGEFREGQMVGGNNLMDWMHKRIAAPYDLYRKYSGTPPKINA